MASPTKRRDMDVMKLLMSDYKVEMTNGDSMCEFVVDFKGPKDSPYEGGLWRVHVELPDAYPYKSPSIGFVNRIYHPNVDEISGSVCLDVINQTWSPMFDLVNVFEVFLPQLLLYPNPADPLNGEAAALLMREPEAYAKKVREYAKKYAAPGAPGDKAGKGGGGGPSKGEAVSAGAAGDDASDASSEPDEYVSSDDEGAAAGMDVDGASAPPAAAGGADKAGNGAANGRPH